MIKSVVNRYGNTWYEIQVGTQKGYIYSGKVKKHNHNFNMTAGTIRVCKCGYYISESQNGLSLMSNALVAPQPLFTPEQVQAVISAVGAAVASYGTSITTAISTVNPVVIAVVVVGGICLYPILTGSAASVASVSLDINSHFEDYDDGRYYACYIASTGTHMLDKKRTDKFLIMDPRGKDIEEAVRFVRNSLIVEQAQQYSSSNKLLKANLYTDVYTFSKSSAEELCKKVCSKYGVYSYGAGVFETGVELHERGILQFQHFHFYPLNKSHKYDIDNIEKDRYDMHIMFGYPSLHPNFSAV